MGKSADCPKLVEASDVEVTNFGGAKSLPEIGSDDLLPNKPPDGVEPAMFNPANKFSLG